MVFTKGEGYTTMYQFIPMTASEFQDLKVLFQTRISPMKIQLKSYYMLYLLYQVKMPQLLNWLKLYRLTFINSNQLHHLLVDWDGQ